MIEWSAPIYGLQRALDARLTMPLRHGRYIVSLARTSDDMRAVQSLRQAAFPADQGAAEPIDAICAHLLVVTQESGFPVCTCRLFPVLHESALTRSYSAQFYDIGLLAALDRRMVELGRFCISPDYRDGDVLRLVWAALTRIVDQMDVDMLFGCVSFAGTDASRHEPALSLLAARHVAPASWRPRQKAPEAIPLPAGPVAPIGAMAGMPPLLRSYLAMGGKVSDHAVIDRAMGTTHVFTGVEIGKIPPTRARSLRRLAALPSD